MKKVILFLFAFVAVLSASAQETVPFRYGCVSYDTLLKSMPEYAKIEADMAELKSKYDTEMASSEAEFNDKYENFLREQANYAPSIKRKRQSELEDMMRRNEQFRKESLRLLDNARKEMINTAKKKLDAVIRRVAEEYQLAFVLNTDSDAVPYLNASMAFNITTAVGDAIK